MRGLRLAAAKGARSLAARNLAAVRYRSGAKVLLLVTPIANPIGVGLIISSLQLRGHYTNHQMTATPELLNARKSCLGLKLYHSYLSHTHKDSTDMDQD